MSPDLGVALAGARFSAGRAFILLSVSIVQQAGGAQMSAIEQQAMLSVRIPEGLLRELEQVAVEEDRSVAGEVRRLIRRHVEAFRETVEDRMAA
jgi:hypothetical protein